MDEMRCCCGGAAVRCGAGEAAGGAGRHVELLRSVAVSVGVQCGRRSLLGALQCRRAHRPPRLQLGPLQRRPAARQRLHQPGAPARDVTASPRPRGARSRRQQGARIRLAAAHSQHSTGSRNYQTPPPVRCCPLVTQFEYMPRCRIRAATC